MSNLKLLASARKTPKSTAHKSDRRIPGRCLSGLLLGLTIFLAQPRPAKALDVAVVICDVGLFSCPAGDIVGDSLFQFIPGNLLRANHYIVQPVAYSDLGVSFTGTFVTADAGGKFIYAWGTGTATDNNAALAGDFLDVSIRQNYVTVPGTWTFGETMSGGCDANATADTSSVASQGQVNGVNLPAVLGGVGDCATGSFSFAAGGFTRNVGTVTQMLAGAQFLFNAGNVPQSINLPFGSDFPDPTINDGNFITNTDIPDGFTQDMNTPEPSALALEFLAACFICGFAYQRSPRRIALTTTDRTY